MTKGAKGANLIPVSTRFIRVLTNTAVGEVDGMDLSERKQRILQAIVDEYIGTAEPVGSRSISKRDELGLSSATIRNEMADLEDMGYIVKPHTSAGRVPSDTGYRFYVNSLMQQYQISANAIEALRRELADRVSQLDMLIRKASALTSALTEYTTVVTSPALNRMIIRKLDLIPMSGGNAMLILVTKSGVVKNRMISADITEAEASTVTSALNEALSGVMADQVDEDLLGLIAGRVSIGGGVSTEKTMTVLKYVYEFIMAQDERDVYVESARSMLRYPEFADVDKARDMLSFLEDRDTLIKIIDSGNNSDGVGIKIGTENNVRELENTSLITVNYRVGDRTLGKIGVIGPKRMNYAKVVASLDLISGYIDEILKELFTQEGEERYE